MHTCALLLTNVPGFIPLPSTPENPPSTQPETWHPTSQIPETLPFSKNFGCIVFRGATMSTFQTVVLPAEGNDSSSGLATG